VTEIVMRNSRFYKAVAKLARAIVYVVVAKTLGLDGVGAELPISTWVQLASNSAGIRIARARHQLLLARELADVHPSGIVPGKAA
jgi:hypothetical protein